jgi:hypothetical protein
MTDPGVRGRADALPTLAFDLPGSASPALALGDDTERRGPATRVVAPLLPNGASQLGSECPDVSVVTGRGTG